MERENFCKLTVLPNGQIIDRSQLEKTKPHILLLHPVYPEIKILEEKLAEEECEVEIPTPQENSDPFISNQGDGR